MPCEIYRITHYSNLGFILKNGLHCHNSELQDKDFTSIGFPALISQRDSREVPLPPGGTLLNYVPFYFTVRSPMLYVIHCGNDPELIKTPQEEIIYLFSTVERTIELNCQFVFTDRHARLEIAEFFNRYPDLNRLNWEIIKSRNWGRQYGPDRKEIKQAEFLIHRFAPADLIMGIGVQNEGIEKIVKTMLLETGRNIPVKIKEDWYF